MKNNGKPFYPLKKLVTGVILFVSFFVLYNYIGGTDGLSAFERHLKDETFSFMSKGLASISACLIIFLIGILMLYCVASGLYRICTFNIYNPVFEDKFAGGTVVKGSDLYPNINRVLKYRESKMCGMSSERAADLYVSSSKIESLYSGYNNGPETMRTLSFIESKLSGMSSDRALNYLANKL